MVALHHGFRGSCRNARSEGNSRDVHSTKRKKRPAGRFRGRVRSSVRFEMLQRLAVMLLQTALVPDDLAVKLVHQLVNGGVQVLV